MAIPFPEEVVTESIGNTCSCIFDIPIEDFEFGDIGNLGGIDLPGIANLIGSVIEAFVEALLSFAEPVLMILDAKILDLLDWIANALSDPIAFLANIIKIKIIDPIVSKLNVWLPPFSIDIPGFPSFPLPEINPDLGVDWNTPQWLEMIPQFLEFLLGLILLPVKVIIGAFESITSNLEIPDIGAPLLKKIWDGITISFGFPFGSSQFGSVSKFGICFLDELSAFIPPPFPEGGGGQSIPQAGNLIQVFSVDDNNKEIEPAGFLYFNKAAGTKQIRIRVRALENEAEITEIKVQAGASGQVHYTVPNTEVTLGLMTPEITIPVTYDGVNPTGPEIANVIIKIGEEDDTKVFTFQVQSYEKNLVDMVKAAIIEVGGPDAWHEEVNLFAIRYDNSVTNTFRDMLCLAIKSAGSGEWLVKAYKGTTQPGGLPGQTQWPRAKQAASGSGSDFILPGHYPNVWKIGTHTSGSDPAKWQWPAFFQQSPGIFNCFFDKNLSGSPDNVTGATPPVNPSGPVNNSLNGHRADPHYTGAPGELVGNWSAGCQVWNVKSDQLEVMELVMNSIHYTSDTPAVQRPPTSPTQQFSGSRYNYTLLLRNQYQALWDALNEEFHLY